MALALAIGSAVIWAMMLRSAATRDGSPAGPVAANHLDPIRLTFHGDFGELVERDRLHELVSVVQPDWPVPTVSRLMHALRTYDRFHKLSAKKLRSSDSGLTPQRMLEILTDDRRFREAMYHHTEPLLRRTPHGIRVLSRPDANQFHATEMAAHLDVYLSTMAEIGIPLTKAIVAENGERGTLADVLNDAIARFSIDQEIEFTTVAFGLYLPPRTHWTNRFGQTYSFDDLVLKLDRRFQESACAGTHVPYAFAMLVQVDAKTPILSTRSRGLIAAQLKRIAAVLEAEQRPDGSWSEDWYAALLDSGASRERRPLVFPNELLGRVSVTGHHLEWIGLVPRELRPADAAVRRAVDYLVGAVPQLATAARESANAYCPVSHGVQGLLALVKPSADGERDSAVIASAQSRTNSTSGPIRTVRDDRAQ
jgi:hypothetical protein